MAHQVQFIQLSQDEYDNLSTKKEGSLYFTTDTHRIYKGETLYASTTFDQLKFDDLSATSIKVDGVDVSLEGHTHTKADIDDFPENVSDFTNDVGYLTEDDIQDINFENLNATSLKVDNKNVSLEGHTHTKSEITDFPTGVSSFTNDVGYLTETDLQDIEFGELEAESLKVAGKDVSVEGHTHTKDDIEDFPTNVSSFTNDAGYITIDDVDLSECSKVGHTHSVDEIEGWDDTDLKFTNLNAESLKVDGKDVSIEGHTHDKVYDETFDESYISGNCDYYQNIEDRSECDILVCNGYKFKCNESNEYRCINGSPGYYLKLDSWYESYWDSYTDGNFYFSDGYYINVVSLENGQWGAVSGFYRYNENGEHEYIEVYADQQFDEESDAWNCVLWTYSIEDKNGAIITGTQYKYEMTEDYAQVYDESSNESISYNYSYPELWDRFTITAYDGSVFQFVHDYGPYGDPIPGSKGWKKTDTIVKTSDLERFVSEKTPTKVSQLQNDSGFVTSSHSHSTDQIYGLSTYLTKVNTNTTNITNLTTQVNTNKTNITNLTTQVNTNKTDITTLKTNTTGLTKTGITKTTGTITTLNATTINAKDINLTGTLGIDEATISDLNVQNMNVSNGMKIDGKFVATREYVEQMISEQIGQVLTQEEF